MNIYIDMDGVLAKWDSEATPEETKKPGFFLSRTPELRVAEMLLKLVKRGNKVKILSAAYNKRAEMEKRIWLSTRAGLYDVEPIFVPYGEDKSKYIKENGLLIDDFSENLHRWAKTGMPAMKFRNGINGTKGTWKGPSISVTMSADDMVLEIEKVGARS